MEQYSHLSKSHSSDSRNSSHELGNLLSRIDGKPYPCYKDMYGTWSFDRFSLVVDYVQGDAYASPSKFRVQIPHSVACIPSELWNTRTREIATRDYLARTFADAVAKAGGDIRQSSQGWHGAKGGEMTVDRPSQQVLDRTAVIITPDYIEARFTVALPASGRSIMGQMASRSLVEMLPKYVHRGLLYTSLDAEALRLHVVTVENAEYIRQQLPSMGLVAFVGDGSILPRQNGASDAPMASAEAVRFTSPPTMEVS
jgi:predicted ABC-class ATPase